MKTEKSLWTAFGLNLAFSVLEGIGGMMTGSVAILSDAVHDFGDAASIGVSCLLEKKSRQGPDSRHTFGYARYAVIGGCLTTLILIIGAAVMIYHAIERLIHPAAVRVEGMILLAVLGVCINGAAVLVTRKGESVNRKAVNLHLLEDVLGWIITLLGAILMHVLDLPFLDPLLSIAVSVYILIHAALNLREILDILLENVPHSIDLENVKAAVLSVDDVSDVSHLHIWSLDGIHHCATLRVAINGDIEAVSAAVRRCLLPYRIVHVVIEQSASVDRHTVCCFESPEHLHSHPHHHH